MHAAVVAALPFKIPVAHISGGESTEGSIDELIRHSITKMSHLHFASTELYRQRIIQMGEDPWRVIVTGALNLDNLKRENLFNLSNLKMAYGIEPTDPILLVTYHPVTLEYEHTRMQMRELLSALEETNFNIIFTYPNADTSSRIIIEMINKFVRKNKNSQMAINLGTQAYFGLMRCASAMVGNSSSGIIEAASFGLPVVNIGNRQSGRVRGKNVIDVGYEKAEILSGINKATSLEFRNEIENLINPYGSGNASEKIIDKLKNIKIDNNLLIKKFHQMSSK
jgi:UDP-hydrolysing UDP-N-acetyl-D-glucosamine 2-epimerase